MDFLSSWPPCISRQNITEILAIFLIYLTARSFNSSYDRDEKVWHMLMGCPPQWNSDIRAGGIMEEFVPSIRHKCGDIICDICISQVDNKKKKKKKKKSVELGNPLVKPKMQEGEECHGELWITSSSLWFFYVETSTKWSPNHEERENPESFLPIVSGFIGQQACHIIPRSHSTFVSSIFRPRLRGRVKIQLEIWHNLRTVTERYDDINQFIPKVMQSVFDKIFAIKRSRM